MNAEQKKQEVQNTIEKLSGIQRRLSVDLQKINASLDYYMGQLDLLAELYPTQEDTGLVNITQELP